MVDIPGDSTTTATASVGSTITGTLETPGDHDWYRITLTAGQTITVGMTGTGASALVDPYLYIRDSNGVMLIDNDDGGSGRNSMLTFQASYSGTYYIDAAAWEDPDATSGYTGTGDYQLSVKTYVPPSLGTVDQFADQLVSGYWEGESAHFAVSPGGSLTVNLTALTAEGQALARSALAQWGGIIGVTFNEVAGAAQIRFDDSDEGEDGEGAAYSEGVWVGGIIQSATVNVSAGWLDAYGTTLNSYSYQTYLHEVGHALGLGHAGHYNGDATFPYDALYENDAWPMTIMSYFAQYENSYYTSRGYSSGYALTPMLADIVAITQLYGVSTTTRAGNTTYGFNSTADNPIYNTSLYSDVFYTIFDSAGTDTLDFSGSPYAQRIDLRAEQVSNTLGRTGNVAIARGVLIENAIGGSGSDTIIGNSANNVLTGGAGEDTVSYEGAAAGVHVNLGITSQQNTVGAGLDTLNGFESLRGSAFNDVLNGTSTTTSTTTSIYGGAGNDAITSSGAGYHYLYGDEGDDWFVGGAGNNYLYGGAGFDTVDYSGFSSGLTIRTYAAVDTGGGNFDSLNSIEQVIGTQFADHIQGNGATLVAGGGDDVLEDYSAAATLIGGVGNDVYIFSSGNTAIVEAAGQGVDRVEVHGSFTLGANIENLTLRDAIHDPYAGVAYNPTVPSSDFSGTGNDLANVIVGNSGANVLDGAGGNDQLIGGSGNDTLRGGAGNDILEGGAGSDVATVRSLFLASSMVVGSQVSIAGPDGTDTVSGVEFFEFIDGDFIIDANSVGAQVTRLYDAALARAPDTIGLDWWVDIIEDSGWTLAQVAHAFVSSAEFSQATSQLNNGELVDYFYMHALGRTADPDGRTHWINRLEGGMSLGDLLLGFSESDEHRMLTADSVALGYFQTDDNFQAIALLYDTFAGRLPDADGLQYWAALLQSGTMTLEQIAEGFAGSFEFQHLTAGLTHAELVDFMYNNALDRDPDAAGREYWIQQLDGGMTDGGLLMAFSQSYEHIGLFASHITGGIDHFG